MIRLAAVVWRELEAQKAVFPAALVLGLLPLALMLLPLVRNTDPQGVRDLVALFVAGIFLAGSLVIFGSDLLNRDWSEGRMGFFLAHPIRAWQLWLGKLVGAGLLAGAGAVVVLVPSVLSGGRPWSRWDPVLWLDRGSPLVVPSWDADPFTSFQYARVPIRGFPITPGLVLFALAAIFLFAYLLGGLLRLRGPETLVGLSILGGGALMLAAAFERVAALGGWRFALEEMIESTALLLILLAAAGGFQLYRSGTSIVSARRSLILVSAVGFSASVGAMELTGRSLFRVEPTAIEIPIRLERAPQGGWIALAGFAESSEALMAFASHPASQRFHLLGALDRMGTAPVFSGDGRRLAWYGCEGHRRQSCELRWLDLEDADGGVRTTPVGHDLPEPEGIMPGLALDASGRRVAIRARGGRVLLHSLDDGRLLGRWTPPSGQYFVGLGFDPNGRLHLSQWSNRPGQVEDGEGRSGEDEPRSRSFTHRYQLIPERPPIEIETSEGLLPPVELSISRSSERHG